MKGRASSDDQIFAWRKEVRARLIADRLSIDPVIVGNMQARSRYICRVSSSRFLNAQKPRPFWVRS
jgi:hypothetical protein